jgi:lysophospholipase L1-like esterase
VVRAGVPGEVSAQALARLPEMLDQHSPKLLLLCIGGNDFLRRLGNQQAEANVRAMVKLARGRGIDVLLIGAPEPGFSVTLLKDNTLKSDPIHPNAKGYRVIAERLAANLKKSGAI